MAPNLKHISERLQQIAAADFLSGWVRDQALKDNLCRAERGNFDDSWGLELGIENGIFGYPSAWLSGDLARSTGRSNGLQDTTGLLDREYQ